MSTNFVRIRPEKDLNLKEKTSFWSKLEQEENEKKQQELKKAKELKLNERNLLTNKLPVQNNPLKNSLQNNAQNSAQNNAQNNAAKPVKEPAGEEQVTKKIDKLKIESEIVKKREQFWAEQEAEERRQREEENRRRLAEKRAIENEIRNSENHAKQIVNTFNNPSQTNSTVKKINAIDEINLEKKKVLSSIKNSLNNDKENAEANIPAGDDDGLDDLCEEIVIHEEEESLSEADINNRTFTKQVNTSGDYYKLRAEFVNPADSPAHLTDQRISEEDEVYDDEEYENEYCLDNGLSNYTTYLSKRLSNEPLEDILEEDENPQEDDELNEYIEGKGKCARALFDYSASDDTEISFLPNDIITHIEQIYEDNTSWLKGRTKDGKEGLFPANHCELIN